MSFQVRDLMLDVLPERFAGPCQPNTGNQPCQDPSCNNNTVKAAEDRGESAGLPALAVLREQLQGALRS
jgi:hypothetical protein